MHTSMDYNSSATNYNYNGACAGQILTGEIVSPAS